jgi:hypothetical protein
MGVEGTPWLDARGLRMQLDEILPVVRERVQREPDHQFSGRVQGKLLTILAVIHEHYGSRLIPKTGIDELLLAMGSSSPQEPITAEEMWIVLGSVRASLKRLEELEEQTTPYGYTANVEVSPPWSPVTDHPDSPPGEPGDSQGGPGDRRYWIGADRQRRRTAARRGRELPW